MVEEEPLVLFFRVDPSLPSNTCLPLPTLSLPLAREAGRRCNQSPPLGLARVSQDSQILPAGRLEGCLPMVFQCQGCADGIHISFFHHGDLVTYNASLLEAKMIGIPCPCLFHTLVSLVTLHHSIPSFPQTHCCWFSSALKQRKRAAPRLEGITPGKQQFRA